MINGGGRAVGRSDDGDRLQLCKSDADEGRDERIDGEPLMKTFRRTRVFLQMARERGREKERDREREREKG